MTGVTSRPGLSIVCVYNDPDVRRDCLDRSIGDYTGEVDVDYLPIDNTGHAYATAGAALGAGAALARHEVVVLVHQDVYLHDVDRLAENARVLLEERTWGVVGANGVTAEGRSTGRLRDRVQLIGDPAPEPTDVDSLDEVLIMVRRELLVEHPLSEDPDLAWHAYAVELGLRYRDLGYRVGAVDCAITHNSLTVNLARLDVAHRRVAELHPDHGVVRTTCGTVGAPAPGWRASALVRSHGWRLRWLRLSRQAWQLHRRVQVPVVISDIRHEVDLLDLSDDTPLELVNLDRGGGFARRSGNRVVLERLGKRVAMRAVGTTEDLVAAISDVPSAHGVLADGLDQDSLSRLLASQPSRTWLAGVSDGELWVLGGPVAESLPEAWTDARAVPLGLRRSLSALAS